MMVSVSLDEFIDDHCKISMTISLIGIIIELCTSSISYHVYSKFCPCLIELNNSWSNKVRKMINSMTQSFAIVRAYDLTTVKA